MYDRIIPLAEMVEHRSLFLLGPRQTGKSTLLRHLFPKARYVDLLEADTFRLFSSRPETLRQSLREGERLIIINEVQKLPNLLDEVQAMIDRDKQLRFILTGSSARKLRGGRANLLAGRAWVARLHPLVSKEAGYGQWTRRLTHGSLPAILDSPTPVQDLNTYVGTYLQEEIRAEGIARSIEAFSRFLEVAGLCNGEVLNYSKVGNDAQIPPRTVREYFQVLEDTLVGFQLKPWRKSTTRKAIATPKFYFFDVGVANALLRRGPVEPGSMAFGRTLEHLVFLELKAWLEYRRREETLGFWRTQAGQEVDFVVGDSIGIEVKGTGRIGEHDFKGLRALRKETTALRRIVVTTETTARRTDDGIEILPVGDFLFHLWEDDLGYR